MATLKFRKTDKSGSSSYAIEGLKSSVYFNKGMFAADPPTTLEITLPEGFQFGEPGKSNAGAVGMTKEQREARQRHEAHVVSPHQGGPVRPPIGEF